MTSAASQQKPEVGKGHYLFCFMFCIVQKNIKAGRALLDGLHFFYQNKKELF